MKKIILLFMPFLLAGCTVNYELQINENLSLEEKITVLNNEAYFNKEGEAETRYKYIVDLGMNEKGYNNYEYLKRDDLYGGIAKATYLTLEEFKEKATSYKELYQDIEIKHEGSIITLNTVGKFNLKKIVAISDQETLDQSIPQNVYFSIKLPFNVLMHNADKIDEVENIYYWLVDESTTENKVMMIQFDSNKKHFNFIKELKKIDYTIPVIIGIIIIVIIFINNAMKKGDINNRI